MKSNIYLNLHLPQTRHYKPMADCQLKSQAASVLLLLGSYELVFSNLSWSIYNTFAPKVRHWPIVDCALLMEYNLRLWLKDKTALNTAFTTIIQKVRTPEFW